MLKGCTQILYISINSDKTILIRDVRCTSEYTSKFVGHKQEICGLKWSFDDRQLASGGNDNTVRLTWDLSLYIYINHIYLYVVTSLEQPCIAADSKVPWSHSSCESHCVVPTSIGYDTTTTTIEYAHHIYEKSRYQMLCLHMQLISLLDDLILVQDYS
jgi:WD40 repeat protein